MTAASRRGSVAFLTLAALAAVALAVRPHAQGVAGRGAIQSAGGGRGPGAAPEAGDPANAGADLSPKPPVVAATPEEEAKRFWLPAGYRLDPILADPVIEDPAQVAFDGNGRMFVVELRGYFETPEGIDLIPPIGRISRHEDRDGDGVYERHTVFVDKLVFPRFVTPFGANSILTMETNTDEVWKYTDTDGDGVADTRVLFTTNFGRAGTVESQQSSLFWAMDNWLYSTVNAYRLRWTPAGVLKEPTGPNGGQWGVTQDNAGKVWFQGGATGLPGYFQFPVHYGNFAPPDQLEPGLDVVWGAPILVGDIQAGLPGTRMPDGSLIYATASAGNEIYRGDRLPKDLIGDYLYGEEVGRLVRRLRPFKTEGLTQLRNVYPRSEFIRSLDPCFRPVDVTTAPDGTVYIADMYRGMIEGAEWAREGTYLRQKINQYQLDKVMHHGRIWRLSYDGIARDRTRPRMLDESAAQLVTHLSHPNGWWRDTAQQLLVLRQDTSVVPALERLVGVRHVPDPNSNATTGSGSNPRLTPDLVPSTVGSGTSLTPTLPLARIHALWTLEGLGALTLSLVQQLMQDPDPALRIQALRASETLHKAGDHSFVPRYRTLATDRDADIAIQAMLTANVLKVPDVPAIVNGAMAANAARGVQFVGDRILHPPNAGAGRGNAALTSDQQQSLERGGAIYAEVCSTCHGEAGLGAPLPGAAGMTMAPALAGSPRVLGHRDYVINAVVHGLAGPVGGKTYTQVMSPMGSNGDRWVADVASYVRNAFGNAAGVATPADVARVRASTAGRTTPWRVEDLEASLPRLLVPDATWKVTASHEGRPNPQPNANGGYNFLGGAAGGLNLIGWTTGVPQQAGMWFQVELPAPASLVELQFTSSSTAARGSATPTWTFPRVFQVQVSDDGTAWRDVIASRGVPGTTIVTFPPVTARFVRITQTDNAADAPPWSMRLLRLYARGS